MSGVLSTPATTPPAHVRTVTLEDLDARVSALEARGGEDYVHARDLRSLVEANHLATMHQLGELARLLRSLTP